MKEFTIYEMRRYSVRADSPQEALEAARAYPHIVLNADVTLDLTSLRAAVDDAVNAVNDLWNFDDHQPTLFDTAPYEVSSDPQVRGATTNSGSQGVLGGSLPDLGITPHEMP